MANHRRKRTHRGACACGMCKYYKQIGNAKAKWTHRDLKQISRYREEILNIG